MNLSKAHRVWAVAAVVMSSALGAGCDEKLSSLTGPTPTLESTFSSISREIFGGTDATGRSPCVTCHAGPSPPAGLNLEPDAAYAALVNVPSVTNPGGIRVVPGDPDNSILIRKLEGGPGLNGARMPFNGPPYLTAGQVAVIRHWIQDGALNN